MQDNFSNKICNAPQTPGVYLLKDGEGHVLYVGKSINIRKRLLQHSAAMKAGWTERNYRRVHHVADVSWRETGSELYALLLEDFLIKKYWPMANVRQKDFLEYAYLAISEDVFPRLVVIDAAQRERFTRILGPFRNSFYAQDMADLIQERFQLRTCCAISEGGCMQWEIGKCSGPCRHINSDHYLVSMEQAIRSLQATDDSFTEFINKKIQTHAQNQEFEKAAHYRDMQRRYQAFVKRQKFQKIFLQHGLLVREKGEWPNTFIFLQGNLIERKGEVVPIELMEGAEWQVLDRANVIYQWIYSRRSECAAAFIDKRFFLQR